MIKIKTTLFVFMFSLATSILSFSLLAQNAENKTIFLVDNSFSMREKNIQEEKYYVENIVKKYSEIELLVFSNTVGEKKSFQVANGVEELLSYLSSLTYDGASYFPRGLDLLNSPEVWLFSDGNFFNQKYRFLKKLK